MILISNFFVNQAQKMDSEREQEIGCNDEPENENLTGNDYPHLAVSRTIDAADRRTF